MVMFMDEAAAEASILLSLERKARLLEVRFLNRRVLSITGLIQRTEHCCCKRRKKIIL